jgi:uroporphyrinogen decarboxylase
MNSRERILAVLSLKEPDQVPFADTVEHSVKEKLMGRRGFTETEFARALGLDAVGIDDYAAPIFCRTQESRGREYVVDGLIKRERDMNLMNFPSTKDDCFYDSAKRFVDQHSNDGLGRYAKCRWGISGVLYSMGVTGLAYALYDHPGLVEKILDRYVEWNCAVMERLNPMGFDFIMDYDNIAFKNGPFVSPQVFREVFIPRIKLVANVCKLPWVFHGDGDLRMILDDLLTLGMNCIHPIEPPCMNMLEMKFKYGRRVCLWGNIDLNTLAYAQPEEVKEEVKQRIKEAGQDGGYILGSANSLPDYGRIENIWAMARAVKLYGQYPLHLD